MRHIDMTAHLEDIRESVREALEGAAEGQSVALFSADEPSEHDGLYFDAEIIPVDDGWTFVTTVGNANSTAANLISQLEVEISR